MDPVGCPSSLRFFSSWPGSRPSSFPSLPELRQASQWLGSCSLLELIHLFFGWHTRSAGAVIWKILVGLAYLVAGFYILGHPGRGLLTLTLILAFYLFFEGIFEGVIYAQLRRLPGAGWFLFDAIVTIVLGIMILMSWPVSSVWAIGTLIGISILFSGIARLSYAFAARRAGVAAAA